MSNRNPLVNILKDVQTQDYSMNMSSPLGERLRELPGPILITGHTGFKGAWLTFLLEHLNVPVVGFSLPAAALSLYDRCNREGAIPEVFGDIRDPDVVQEVFARFNPSVVMHLAAQPLVLESYKNPVETFETNIMGTANILSAAFDTKSVEAILVTTTDKVYKNDNSSRAFIETDPLEGKDPYSASKVGTEAVIAAWQQLAKVNGGPKVVAARAGNVIGGGDWAKDRLIPDIVRNIIVNQKIAIRNPESTRPWQHVLDPIRGYVMLLDALLLGEDITSMNFGPEGTNLSVKQVCEIALASWGAEYSGLINYETSHAFTEAKFLILDSSAAKIKLGWKPFWNQQEAVIDTINWWAGTINDGKTPIMSCQKQIEYLVRD
jgi:CDP-glucose 4,6-dehydratase